MANCIFASPNSSCSSVCAYQSILWNAATCCLRMGYFIIAYLHGIDIQAKHSHPFLKKKKIELQWKRVVSWLLVFCSIWYALLEAAGVIYSLRPKQGFFVIQKPSLAAENKIDTTHMQAYQQSLNTIPMERKV